MKNVILALAGGLLAGVLFASHAKLPPAPAKSDEQKKVEADKAAAAKAHDADMLNKAVEKAVANAKKNGKTGPASMDGKK
jgi:hypothetical protein